MSDYPEHDKLQQVSEQTQAIGEFLDWLGTQGIQLMTWREDLTDERPTDPDCTMKAGVDMVPLSCDPVRTDSDDYGWRRRHCQHWQDPQHETDGDAQAGTCCRCGRGRYYEVHNVKAWIPPGRDTLRLLAGWAGIDLDKIEAEKRAMLAKIRADAEADQ